MQVSHSLLGIVVSLDSQQTQLPCLADFHAAHAAEALAMLAKVQVALVANTNVFDVLMEAVRACSLGQISSALFKVGGRYRRSM